MINARNAAATVARGSFRDRWYAVAPTITTARPGGVDHVNDIKPSNRDSISLRVLF